MSAENLRGAYILGIISGLLIMLGSLALLPGLARLEFVRYFAIRCAAGMCVVQPGSFARLLTLGLAVPLLVGLLSGVLVLISAVQIGRARAPSSWGAVMLAFSLISLLAGGGFLMGALLGIVAGALALATPSTQAQRPPPSAQGT
jgi:hypothetical protein